MAHIQDHDFYIPPRSVWPPLSCLGVFCMMLGLLCLFHVTPVVIGWMLVGAGLITTLIGAIAWWQETIKESRARGFKSVPLVLDLANRYGIIFFIVSEVMFFAAFFAVFFYLKSYNIAFPPTNLPAIDIHLPVINTLLLLSSGVTITWAHHALLAGKWADAKLATFATWHLGILFLLAQMYEYSHVGFSLSDTAYGSIFYMMTGFHGFHVLVGTIMLMVVSYRLAQKDFSEKHHFYFEATAWYWHFVDVVWIGLFLFVYVL